MILTEVVDVTEVTDAQRGNCIPMFEVILPNNRPGEEIEHMSDCHAVGQSREKPKETGDRNGPKSPAIVTGKAAPPVPPPDRLGREIATGTDAGIGSCNTVGTSQTGKHAPPSHPSDNRSTDGGKEQSTDGGHSKPLCKAPPAHLLEPIKPQWKEPKAAEEAPWEMGIGTRLKNQGT